MSNSGKDDKKKSPQEDIQGLKALVDAVVPLAREYIDFKKQEFEAREKRITLVGKHNRSLTYSILGFMLGIIALMTVLTFTSSISSDALLFLVGTITGYMIIWAQDLIFSPTEEATES